jgi:hypothetical protein
MHDRPLRRFVPEDDHGKYGCKEQAGAQDQSLAKVTQAQNAPTPTSIAISVG